MASVLTVFEKNEDLVKPNAAEKSCLRSDFSNYETMRPFERIKLEGFTHQLTGQELQAIKRQLVQKGLLEYNFNDLPAFEASKVALMIHRFMMVDVNDYAITYINLNTDAKTDSKKNEQADDGACCKLS